MLYGNTPETIKGLLYQNRRKFQDNSGKTATKQPKKTMSDNTITHLPETLFLWANRKKILLKRFFFVGKKIAKSTKPFFQCRP